MRACSLPGSCFTKSMGKLKINTKYGTAPHSLLNNEEITFKAKGIFTFLQAKPDGWKFSTERIASQTAEGEKAIRSGLQELENHGYLKRTPAREEDGRWGGYDYTLYAGPEAHNPSAEKRPTDKRLADEGEGLSNKDNSKKDIVKKNKNKEGKPSLDTKELNRKAKELMDYFHDNINPEMPFNHKTQWDAARYLIEKYGHEKAMNAARAARQANQDQYAPTITSPCQLRNNFAKLAWYYKKQQNASKGIKI